MFAERPKHQEEVSHAKFDWLIHSILCIQCCIHLLYTFRTARYLRLEFSKEVKKRY